jgi:hypothetical protein
MEIEVLVEGENLPDVEAIRLPVGSAAREIVALVAAKGGFPAEEAVLFLEDGDNPLDLALVLVEEQVRGKVHHVHRARQVDVTVFYLAGQKEKRFPPSARIQRVLDWAVGPEGFRIDPAIAPEMVLAKHGTTTALPKNAHIGRFVTQPHSLKLDLIRGVVPNGAAW